jgi:hypothetical protein
MMRRKRRWDRGIILLVPIVAIVLAMGVFAYSQLRTDLFTETLKRGQPVAVLFAFAGDTEYDFFELFLYQPQTRRGAVIHIPGNVGLIIESLKRVDRLDVLYERRSGGTLEPLASKVEELTGLSIPFRVDIREQQLVGLVDLLGGLELFIPNPVDTVYRDKRVLLPSGSVVLDGDKMRDFVSYQDPLESELDWAGRKQKFLQVLLKQIGESDILSHKSSQAALRGLMQTNLGPRALTAFVAEMKRLESDKMVFQRVLGSVRVVDGKELLFPHFEGQLLKEIVSQTRETIASVEPFAEEDLTLAVEVLNGTAVPGLARRAANVFQSYGYDVVLIGNADNAEYEKTAVLDRKGRIEPAEKVAELIRCPRTFSRLDEGADLSVDVTVILGRDFDGRYCKE